MSKESVQSNSGGYPKCVENEHRQRCKELQAVETAIMFCRWRMTNCMDDWKRAMRTGNLDTQKTTSLALEEPFLELKDLEEKQRRLVEELMSNYPRPFESSSD